MLQVFASVGSVGGSCSGDPFMEDPSDSAGSEGEFVGSLRAWHESVKVDFVLAPESFQRGKRSGWMRVAR